MKKSLGILTTFLILMFCLQIAQGWFVMQAEVQAREAVQATQELLLNGKTASAKAAKQTAIEAKQGDEIIAKVESQLSHIYAGSDKNEALINDSRTMLCETLLFDELTPSVYKLARSMYTQNCAGVVLPPDVRSELGKPPVEPTTTTTVAKAHQAKSAKS